MQHTESGIATEGMGESDLAIKAKLLATAEAYERIAFLLFEATSPILQKQLPFGMGVGFTENSAQLRAFGEYFERADGSQLSRQSQEAVQKKLTPLNIPVYIARIPGPPVGTGYGRNSAQALDSAQRSHLRKIDFPQEAPLFEVPSEPPEVFCITPPKEAWLEVYLVGHRLK